MSYNSYTWRLIFGALCVVCIPIYAYGQEIEEVIPINSSQQTETQDDSRYDAIEIFESYESSEQSVSQQPVEQQEDTTEKESGQQELPGQLSEEIEMTEETLPESSDAIETQTSSNDTMSQTDYANEILAAQEAFEDMQERMEILLSSIASRSSFTQFFIGAKYGEIERAQRLHEQMIEQLEVLERLYAEFSSLAKNKESVTLTPIDEYELYAQSIPAKLDAHTHRFSLFGWLVRLLS